MDKAQNPSNSSQNMFYTLNGNYEIVNVISTVLVQNKILLLLSVCLLLFIIYYNFIYEQ
jgi:hypothetical protein